jgi:hypothetical protein
MKRQSHEKSKRAKILPVEFENDRLLMLADFGVSAVWKGTTFTAIFDNDYQDAEVGGSLVFAVSQPRLTCRSSDVNGAADGDAITVAGVSYVIRVPMNDGTGMTTLVLEAQS